MPSHLTSYQYTDLVNQVVVITGAASGIGAATAKFMARQGCKVVIADINKLAGQSLCQEIELSGFQASYIQVDVTSPVSIQAAITKIINDHQQINVLINCAGFIRRANVLNLTEEEWDQSIAINLKSVYLLARAVIPCMQQQGHGNIVNVASGWGLIGGANAVGYCAAKGGVVQITRAMAVDHGKDGIRVNCVCPGDTNTPMLVSEAKQLGLAHDALIQDGCHRPLGRVGEPEEIASTICFLASTASSFMTGSVLVVDGGGLAGSM
ncbi:SDR family NAD(P)-dependent oxidoreductase [Alcaligenes nematophilus]|uniref:SDR family NAD(P)-dependent oxidoreductase n=1 Tax=Alcaligenes sp. PF14 TaxID=3120297 RepID=UPI003018D54B